jgi:membrane fusion protein
MTHDPVVAAPPTKGLFRPEVLESRSESWLGPMRVMPPPLARGTLVASILLLIAAGCVLSMGGYAKHAHAEGSIVSSSGVATIVATADGTIARMEVHDGQRVHRGQILFTLSGEATTSNGDDTGTERVALLTGKERTLATDLRSLDESKAESFRELSAQVDSKQVQMRSLTEQIQIQQKRTAASQQLYEQWVRLGSTGFVSRAQVIQQRDAVLAGQASESQIRGNRAKLGEELAAVRSSINRLDSEVAGHRRELERALSDVDTELAAARLELGSAVRSPVDGVVSTVLLHPGQHASRQETILNVMPSERSAMAEIWIPSTSIGFVAMGQRVNLKYQAYPFRAYGLQTGVVTEVADIALGADAVGKVLGRPVDEPRYRVLVRLDRQDIVVREGSRPLKVGMLLEADVILGKHRLIDWLLDPLDTFKSREDGHGA